ncbi:MAG TPA: response regulator [Candidatus Sulfotelmatobacter sp.]|jgi:DNA-binding response OmpR family regulator|nr:response regulator [Candidatus Sulfotelmatobacter sp.]
MSEETPREPGTKPNVYFIDDSATMREVVKIAFRRENFNVVTCSDMASAVAQFEQTVPDAVISDVIMPDKDGYQLCEYVKQHPQLGATPVFLMSGVVNKEVAERAHQVKADELIRKPFHPQDLVARVKKLLNRGAEPPQAQPPAESGPASPLSRFFDGASNPFTKTPPPQPFAPAAPRPAPPAPAAAPAAPVASASNAQELQKLRMEVKRLESLVKKLQSDLASEREYRATLESQLQTIGTPE